MGLARAFLPAWRIIAALVVMAVVSLGAPRAAEATPSAEWRLDFVIVSVDPDAPLELYNPQGDEDERLVERVKGVVLNGLLDATSGYFYGNRPVVLLAVVRRFDGISTEATVLAGGEMRATIDVWFADAVTTEELTPVRTLEVSRVTLGNVGGIFAHFVGGSQTTRYSRSIANSAREWLAGLDTLAALGPVPATALPEAVREPSATSAAPLSAPAAPVPDRAPEPVVAERSPVGGIPPVVVAEVAPEPEIVPEVVAVVEPEPVPEPVAVAEVVPEAEEPSLFDTLFGSSEPEAEPEAAVEAEPVAALAEPVAEPVPEPAAEPEAAPEAEEPSLLEALFGGSGEEAAEAEAPAPEAVAETEVAAIVPEPEPVPAAEPAPGPAPETAVVPEPEPAPEPAGAALTAPIPVVRSVAAAPAAAAEPAPEPAAAPEPAPEPAPVAAAPEPAPAEPAPAEPAPVPEVAPVTPRVAAVSPAEQGPTLANARWVGFSPAAYGGGDAQGGLWIAGPFDREQREGWITDTATGSTVKVTFLWRDPSAGSPQASLSREAAEALGLAPGQVANVAVYLPR